MSFRNQVFTIIRFLAVGLWFLFMLYNAFSSQSWWHALFYAGLGGFIIQVGIAIAQASYSDDVPTETSELQRRLSQVLVFAAFVGFIGIFISLYV